MSGRDTTFVGENQSTIDVKGRTCIPAKFRDVLVKTFGSERFVITKAQPIDVGDDYARGLSVFPVNVWDEIKAKTLANQAGYSSLQLDAVKRRLINPAVECETDKLGRVLIPPSLREHAGLEKDLLFVGMDRRFDIWSKVAYDRVNDQDEKNLPLDLSGIGF